MATNYPIYVWKKSPFIRILIPFVAGILLQYFLSWKILPMAISGGVLIVGYYLFSILPDAWRFKYSYIQGSFIMVGVLLYGSFITFERSVKNQQDWYGNQYSDAAIFVATLSEPLVEKPKSYKALAAINAIIKNDSLIPVQGKVILYIAKDFKPDQLSYGSRIVFKKPLQSIKNSGNPGAFDYANYSALRQLYHQVYLKNNEWIQLPVNNKNAWNGTIFSIRKSVVNIINQYITGKEEASIAKALLIGYKVDLDSDLVQAYSNAGVVHLIAISGLHMGIIYSMLIWFFSRISFIRKSKILTLALVLACLWSFAFLTGAAPSVMRAACMFSFIVLGKAFDHRSSVYNSLAGSAFFLLLINPYVLWDVGFQLSYLAVLGIVTTQRYISQWFYFKNKPIQYCWQLMAVSLSAQLFTLPVCLYYFHQFPLLFLIANLIAIPLATLILWLCVSLIFLSIIPLLAFYLGKLLEALLWLLNKTVISIDAIPFSLWEGFSISLFDSFLLYAIIIAILIAAIHRVRMAVTFSLLLSLLLVSVIAVRKWDQLGQRKLLVYHIPAHSAMELIKGNQYALRADSQLIKDKAIHNFNWKPARLFLGAHQETSFPNTLSPSLPILEYYGKRIFLMDSAIALLPLEEKIKIDYIILSKSPKISITEISQYFNCDTYVFDASNTLWKIDQWKRECEELHLHFHSVSEQGAFLIDL